MHPRAKRSWIPAGSALIALSTSALGPAHAQGPVTPQQCSAAYDQAQVLRRDRKLRAAHEQLVLCSQSKCPGVITADCGPWLREVESGLPSVVFVARDAAGNDVPALKVSMDGALLTSRLSGDPLDVDPGEHTFTLEPEHGSAVTLKLLINMGEKNRLVQVAIREAAPAAAEPTEGAPKRGSLVPGIVVGVVGVAGLGASLGLYLSAKSGIDGLRSTCAPNCSSGDVDPLRTRGLVSDVVFGVGVAALGAAGLMILLRPSDKSAPPGAAAGLLPILAPTAGGGMAGLGGRF
jgi:hypothetical protein